MKLFLLAFVASACTAVTEDLRDIINDVKRKKIIETILGIVGG